MRVRARVPGVCGHNSQSKASGVVIREAMSCACVFTCLLPLYYNLPCRPGTCGLLLPTVRGPSLNQLQLACTGEP